MRRVRTILAVAITCAGWPATAHAVETVKFSASLTPEHLDRGTTIGFGLGIGATTGLPSPLTSVDVSYPEHLGIALSGIGIRTCQPRALEVFGPLSCPADSRMGFGRATALVPFGPEVVREQASIGVVRGPTREGHLTLLFYAVGQDPVSTELILPGTLDEARPPYGGEIIVGVPLVPTLPEAPNASLVSLKSTIGPLHLTYFEEVNHRVVPYRPAGILLPQRCPRGGFPFAARLGFEDGSDVAAHTTVPCPRAAIKRRRHP